MAAQTGKSILGGLKNRVNSTLKKHVDDDVDVGPQDLPPGIKNGVARVDRCYFDVYKSGDNAGKPYLRATAVVLEPEFFEYEGRRIKVAGRQTSIMIPLCETKNMKGEVTTIEEAAVRVQNRLKALGASRDDVEDVEQFESTAAAIEQAGPYVEFSTSPKFDQKDRRKVTGTWENWGLVQEDYNPPTVEGVEDGTGGSPEPTPAASRNGTAPPPSRGGSKDKGESPEPGPDVDEFGDLDSLVDRAKRKDAKAQQQLEEMCKAAGMTDREFEDIPGWDDVGEFLKNPPADSGGEEAEADDDGTKKVDPPRKGDVVNYRPRDKAGKPTKKVIECEVTAVDKKGSACDLKNLDDNRTVYKKVAWDDLEG